MVKIYFYLFILVILSGFSSGVSEVSPNYLSSIHELPLEAKSISDSDYVDAYFVVYGDVISGSGKFSQKELNDVVLYYLSNDDEALSENLLDNGPNSGESVDSILTRAGAKFGSRRSYCYMTWSINDLRCCVDRTVKRGNCYEYKRCSGGTCVDIDCSRYTCGDGWCQWGESDVNSPCCCASDCGITCNSVTTTTSSGTTTTGVTTTTSPTGSCTFPDGSPVPWQCGDGICDVMGWRYWRLSENNPWSPCCCEADCWVKCRGGTTTTTGVTTTTLPSGSCAFPDGTPVPWKCGDGVCDWIGWRYWYLSENNPNSPCCCEEDCWVRCRGGTTTTTSGTTTTSPSTSTTQETTTTSSGTTTTAGSTTTSTTETTTTTGSATTTSTATSTTTTTSSTTTTTTPQTACDEYKATGKLPASWDLRNVNGVNYITPIRDQGNCGSCWAFGAMGAVEGTYNWEQGKYSDINVAEQDVVSCDVDTYNQGCNGGFGRKAIEYMQNSTICDETCFPYKAQDLPCSQRCSWNKKGWKVSSEDIESTINTVKGRLVCGGPMSVSSNYWGHEITLIAYDDNSDICQTQYGTKGCWIIKNSWGVWTGIDDTCGVYHENGYGFIPYTGNKCSDIVGGSTKPGDQPIGPVGVIAP